ncbi:MAG: YcgN family cysteine cluster protein [Thiohalospira sp.]
MPQPDAPGDTLKPFWQTRSLEELDTAQWEALCDGCGHCCMVHLADEDGGGIVETDAACQLLDIPTVRCADYANRHRRVSDCQPLTPELVRAAHWLPETCAYRRVAAGRPLPDWHPLVSGRTEAVHEAGGSVRPVAHPETDGKPWNIIEWWEEQ